MGKKSKNKEKAKSAKNAQQTWDTDGCPTFEPEDMPLSEASLSHPAQNIWKLAALFGSGKGGHEQNEAKAIALMQEAAEAGHPRAMFNLGARYSQEWEMTKAIELYSASAAAGDPLALYNLGIFHCEGLIQGQGGWSKSFACWKAAADQGYVRAQMNTGVCYKSGSGTPINWEQAFYYFALAAEQGDATAQFQVGTCFAYGRGVRYDITTACIFWKLAADQGHRSAGINLATAFRNGLAPPSVSAKDVVKLLKGAASEGRAQASADLASIYASGDCGEDQNPYKAGQYAAKAKAKKLLPCTGILSITRPCTERGVPKRENCAWSQPSKLPRFPALVRARIVGKRRMTLSGNPTSAAWGVSGRRQTAIACNIAAEIAKRPIGNVTRKTVPS